MPVRCDDKTILDKILVYYDYIQTNTTYYDNNQYITKLIQIKDINIHQHYRVLVVVYIIVLMSSLSQ
jgi:hypothetical protein